MALLCFRTETVIEQEMQPSLTAFTPDGAASWSLRFTVIDSVIASGEPDFSEDTRGNNSSDGTGVSTNGVPSSSESVSDATNVAAFESSRSRVTVEFPSLVVEYTESRITPWNEDVIRFSKEEIHESTLPIDDLNTSSRRLFEETFAALPFMDLCIDVIGSMADEVIRSL